MSRRAEHVWRCDCGSGHHLAITVWPSEGNPHLLDLEGYLDVEGDYWTTWRQRLGMAWTVLFKGHAHSRVGLVFDPPKAHAIADVLKDYAVRCDAQRNANGRRISGWTCEHVDLTATVPVSIDAPTVVVTGTVPLCGCQMRPVYEGTAP